MNDDITITALHQPGWTVDPLTEIAREGTRQMLLAALKAEAASFVARFSEKLLSDGRQRVVRHGTGPERTIQTGIGPLAVQRQKVHDRATDMPGVRNIRFISNILPRRARRSRSLDALLPVIGLRGVSTGDFQKALAALPGADAPYLSPGGGHLKRAIADAPMMRGSHDFEDLAACRRFIDEVVGRTGARNAKRIDVERASLKPLPAASRRDRGLCGRAYQPFAVVQGAAKKKFRWRRPRHARKGRQNGREVERIGLANAIV